MKNNFRWVIIALAVIAYFTGSSMGYTSIAFFVMLALTVVAIGVYAYSPVNYILGMNAFTKGDREKAIKKIKNSTKGPFATKTNLLNYAYFIMREGNTDEAKEIFESLIGDPKSTDTDVTNAKSNLAILYSKTGEFDKAVELIKTVFDENKNTNTYGTYGYFLILDGKLDEALKINKEAHEYNNKNATIRDNLALNYYMLGELDKAEEIYNELIKENPTFIDAYYNAGKVKEKLGKKEEAIALFEKAKTIKPSFLSGVGIEQIDKDIQALKE